MPKSLIGWCAVVWALMFLAHFVLLGEIGRYAFITVPMMAFIGIAIFSALSFGRKRKSRKP